MNLQLIVTQRARDSQGAAGRKLLIRNCRQSLSATYILGCFVSQFYFSSLLSLLLIKILPLGNKSRCVLGKTSGGVRIYLK